VELVAAEPDGGKFIAIVFDHAGRMWTMTALEYPLDANEAGPEAKALFARGGRDRVLVFDTPTAPGRQKARTFADELVMPLGLLPHRDGAFVQYGGEIRRYRDTDGDGKADGFTNVLTGFGIEDSHLFPHQFTRAPGGWFWLAQGAFNYSKVAVASGEVTDFNKTKLARWRPDGSKFEIIGWGPCNIWGLVIDRLGEAFIQEANDQGWPMIPFLEGASYPLCGDDVPRPYAPPFPKLGGREMGGTGLSGLAFSEGADSFPPPWRDVFFIANPITERIQAIRLHRGSRREDQAGGVEASATPPPDVGGYEPYGNGWHLEHLPDFLLTSDPWFRPVALSFGPDGCLYIVDWYNKIISHNEVPRTHPERDKTRGRIWRVRHESQPPRTTVPDLYKAGEAELLSHLRATNTWEVNAAWQEIVDRPAVSLAPELAKLAMDKAQPLDVRIRALWSLEGLNRTGLVPLEQLAFAGHRSLRKEAVRIIRQELNTPARLPPEQMLLVVQRGLEDRDRIVRQEAIRLLGEMLSEPAITAAIPPMQLVARLMRGAIGMPASPPALWQNYHDSFDRYLIRLAVEKHRPETLQWLEEDTVTRAGVPERRAFAAVAVGGGEGATRLAAILPTLGRPLSGEELLLVASIPDEPAARAALQTALTDPSNLRNLHDNRMRLTNTATLAPLLVDAARALVVRQPSATNEDLLVKLATGFRLSGLEDQLVAIATRPGARSDAQLAAVRALRESGSTQVEVLRQFAAAGNDAVRREAVLALSAARSDAAVPALLEVWPLLNAGLRKSAVDRLASSTASAKQLVAAIGSGAISRDELDGYTLGKLTTVLPEDPAVRQLESELGTSLQPVLRLEGGDGDHVQTDLTLDGPFTVETWVRLDPGINNTDALLAASGQLDANFHDSRFRIWLGGGGGDIVIARKPIAPESWTHVAFTRDGEGRFRIYLNGELDNTGERTDLRRFDHVQVGLSGPNGGTAGEFAEYRVWRECRSADQIRANANVTLAASRDSNSLLYQGAGNSWGQLRGKARVERTGDLPPVQTEAEAAALEEKFAQLRSLAQQSGNPGHGQQVFATACAVCHTVKGQGGKIGPVLDGAGAGGVEALLRNILTPNAAMEAGYRRFRIETRDGEVQEGMIVSQDDSSIVLRQPNTEDLRVPRNQIKRAGFTRLSVMPEGLIDGLKPEDVSDLFAYLKTLK